MHTQEEPQGPLYRFTSYWRLYLGLALSLAVLASILSGITIFKVFDTRFVLSLFGIIVIIRKILQQRFAFKHNNNAKQWTWEPIITALKTAHPEDSEWLDQVLKIHVTYDDRRKMIQEEYPEELGTKAQWKRFRRSVFGGNEPKAAVISPIYKVSLDEVLTLITTTIDQSYPVQTMYLVVNGKWAERIALVSSLRARVRELNADPEIETRFKLILRAEGDKRRAMRVGFRRAIIDGANLIFNVDSDTRLDFDAIANAVWTFIVRPDVICLTGDVRVSNPNVNFLTLMTAIRYFIAFNIERAAQSLFDQMTCLSGPFLGIRAENLALIMDEWSDQWFLGKRCTFGDDRHLATLCLLLGWVSIFIPEAICWTASPVTRAEHLLQQLRWNKSADRENWILIVVNKLKGLHPYIIFDLFYLTIFPFLVIASISLVLLRGLNTFGEIMGPPTRKAVHEILPLLEGKDYGGLVISAAFVGSFVLLGLIAGFNVLLPYIAIIIGMNVLFQGLYGWRLTGDRRYLFSFAYIWFLPDQVVLKVRAKIDATNTGWLTK